MLSQFDGLDSISEQSLAFHKLAHTSPGDAGTKLLGKTGKTVQEFKLAFGTPWGTPQPALHMEGHPEPN